MTKRELIAKTYAKTAGAAFYAASTVLVFAMVAGVTCAGIAGLKILFAYQGTWPLPTGAQWYIVAVLATLAAFYVGWQILSAETRAKWSMPNARNDQDPGDNS